MSQRSINSFFAPRRPKTVVASEKPSGSLPVQLPRSKTAPTLKPSKSNRAANKSSFFTLTVDEFASSDPDTTLTSPEVNNFRNPALARSFNKENSPPSSPVRKRGSEFLESFGSQPRKMTKKQAPPPKTHSEFNLSPEQELVLNSVLNNSSNVFFTGSAGTGKSVVLRHLVKALYAKYGAARVGVTASTGMAACNVDGQTVHKYLGIGIGTSSPQELAIKIKKNRALKYKWQNMKVLIIDEISMIDGKLFTKICELAKIVRENTKPFGGIQLVCCGDFFQLPPVSKENSAQYCFQSPMWLRVIQKTIVLKQVFRQKGDTELIDMLNALRHGTLTSTMIARFKSLSRKVNYTDGIEPTELYPTRMEVKSANLMRLRNLPGKSWFFKASDNVSDPQYKRIYDNMMCEEVLELKEDCQVMYLKNSTEGNIVNGSVGTVVCFLTPGVWGELVNYYRSALFDPTPELFEELRLLSRCTGVNEWSAEDLAKFETLVPPERKTVFTKLCNLARRDMVADAEPIVNFKTTDGSYSLHKIGREEFYADAGKLRLSSGNFVERFERRQLPLLLAWAMSIHKAQGQSIDRLRINLQKTFEKGQVYVALSRATNKERLELFNFDERKITTSTEVKKFYEAYA